MEETDFLDQHSNYLNTLGRVAVEMVRLETIIAVLFSRILGIPPSMGEAIFFAPQSTGVRLALLRRAAEKIPESFADLRKKVEKITTQALECQNRRNDLLHSLWLHSEEILRPAKTIVPVDWSVKFAPFNLQEFEHLFAKMTKVRLLIDEIMLSEEYDDYPPWQKKSSPRGTDHPDGPTLRKRSRKSQPSPPRSFQA